MIEREKKQEGEREMVLERGRTKSEGGFVGLAGERVVRKRDAGGRRRARRQSEGSEVSCLEWPI